MSHKEISETGIPIYLNNCCCEGLMDELTESLREERRTERTEESTGDRNRGCYDTVDEAGEHRKGGGDFGNGKRQDESRDQRRRKGDSGRQAVAFSDCEAMKNCNFNQWPVGMTYVPMQPWEEPFDLEKGLRAGTIFPSLRLPFRGGGC